MTKEKVPGKSGFNHVSESLTLSQDLWELRKLRWAIKQRMAHGTPDRKMNFAEPKSNEADELPVI